MVSSMSSDTKRDNAPAHVRRIGLLSLLLTVVAVPLVVFVWGPHLPPGDLTAQDDAQRANNVLLAAVATPVVVTVLVFFIYTLTTFRQRGDERTDGPPIQGHGPIQVTWIVVTTTMVTVAAAWGTVGLFGPALGAGGGQGPEPLNQPTGYRLPVQVIAQEWGFTYRYPTYGGVETYTLALPVDTTVEFHVTSLDVVHSFWAYQLGVKADAVPGADNVAYVNVKRLGVFQIRCAELCGLWHAQMEAQGRVMTTRHFTAWAHREQVFEAPELKYLPPYSTTYFPDPPGRAG
jgi:cytochrome c oxidase subunit II